MVGSIEDTVEAQLLSCREKRNDLTEKNFEVETNVDPIARRGGRSRWLSRLR